MVFMYKFYTKKHTINREDKNKRKNHMNIITLKVMHG